MLGRLFALTTLLALAALSPIASAEAVTIQECALIGGGGRCLENRDIISLESYLIEDDVVVCADVFVGCADE